MATYTYALKLTGKINDKTATKSISGVRNQILSTQEDADGFASKFIKLYDTGSTFTKVSKVTTEGFDVSATA